MPPFSRPDVTPPLAAPHLLLAALLVVACTGGEMSSDSASASASAPTGAQTMSASGSASASMSASASESSGENSGSASESATSDGTSSTGPGTKYDLLTPDGGDTGMPGECGCGLGEEYSYIWIANAEEGTVSKINTVTMEEEGRYITRPDGNGNPSRTSVSFGGDVAVANRHGGLTKIYARPSDCVESNGMPGIQTSQGADDILPWGVEECVAWYTEFPATNQRPVAYTQGRLNPATCKYEDTKIWTVTSATPSLPGTGGPGGVIAYLVNGDTGKVEETVDIPDFDGIQLGAYGGAVDMDGNLYFVPMGGITLGKRYLAKVDYSFLTYKLYEMPPNIASYGVTVDHNNRVWISSTIGLGAARFDPATEKWAVVPEPLLSTGGIAQAQDGPVWIATGNPAGAVAVDATGLGILQKLQVPGGTEVKGVGVDHYGYLWLINEAAYRFDPKDWSYEVYDGLSGPYTYSDMTGFALQNTSCEPPS
ncbi:MAG: hypothetical protein H6710_01560 [Myxococcales bacterium]|nr:hypothetical protein [Myxococcales bacterium]